MKRLYTAIVIGIVVAVLIYMAPALAVVSIRVDGRL
jgi:hypothetical protein